ncbi:MAG: DUF2752 domain-containing protein [Bacteroidales bacterium]|nr:DUF2752 domain-containing protein [Bacteroidales bacterium]
MSKLINNMLSGIRNEPYLIINLIFAAAIMLIMAYSAIFSPEKDNYPVVCIHEKLTGEPCASCGLSHSFSLIVRGKISEALQWNLYGLRIFIFFAAQLAMRVVFSVIYMKNKDIRRQLISMDIAGSGIIFLIAFWPLVADLIARFH